MTNLLSEIPGELMNELIATRDSRQVAVEVEFI